jgi:hypothetical protein
MSSDTSLIAALRPFDPAGENAHHVVLPATCHAVVKGAVARSNGPIESVLVHVHETKRRISEQTAPRKLAYPSRRKFTQNPCKGVAGLAVLQTSRADYEKSLLAFFWRASIASMYGIGP